MTDKEKQVVRISSDPSLDKKGEPMMAKIDLDQPYLARASMPGMSTIPN